MDLDKFLEDVKNGIYPLFAFAQPVLKETKSAARLLAANDGNEEHGEESKNMETRKNSSDDTKGLIESMSSASIHKGEQLNERIDSANHLSDIPTTVISPPSTDYLLQITPAPARTYPPPATNRTGPPDR